VAVWLGLLLLATSTGGGSALVLGSQGSSGSSLGDDELPITKVVRLLEDMQRDLEKEAKEDKDTYESLSCWCEKYEKEKSESVEAAKSAIDSLQAKIEGSTGKASELATEVEGLQKRIAENEQALKEAVTLRAKEAAAFHEQEKELLQSIQLLNGAITTLSKHHAAMLQSGGGSAELQTLRPTLRHVVHKNLNLLGWLRTSPYKDALLSLIDANPDILDPDDVPSSDQSWQGEGVSPQSLLFQQQRAASSGDAPFRSYAPQSGQVLGVLKQMKDSFEADMPEMQKDEAKKASNFALLKGEKESEIAEQKSSVKAKRGELADTKEKLWTARNDIKDAKASLSADQAFLLEMQDRCVEGDHEWEKRSKMRADEIAAVSQAIRILTSDEARDGQQTTWGGAASFLQMSVGHRRVHAAGPCAEKVLKDLSRRAPELALISVMARNQPFAKVTEAIDKLVAKLKIEQVDEVKYRDFCIDELHQNEVDSQRKSASAERLDAKADELDSISSNLEKELETIKQEITTLQTELQRATFDRKKENREFQQVVGDQRRARRALKEAHARLAPVFGRHQTGLLQQVPGSGEGADEVEFHKRGSGPRPTVAPAPEFSDYDNKQGSSNQVLTLIQKLTGEAKVLEDASVHDEQNAQAAYETLIAETNDSVKAKSRMIVDKTQELRGVDAEAHRTRAERDRALEDLDALAASKGALHQQCDFFLNFETRQASRIEEMDALTEAKAILAGMSSNL